MTQERIAPPAPETTGQSGQPENQTGTPEYVLRGLGIAAVARDLILGSYQGGGRWIVPSGTDHDRRYEVRVGTRSKRDRCECRGFGSHGHCSHVVAASRVAKGSAVCDSCGVRRWWRELTEVPADSLTWFEGDVLCGSCVRDHGGIS